MMCALIHRARNLTRGIIGSHIFDTLTTTNLARAPAPPAPSFFCMPDLGQPVRRSHADHGRLIVVVEERVEPTHGTRLARDGEAAVEDVGHKHVVDGRPLLHAEALAVDVRPRLRYAVALRL
eukprot:2784443-Prymnesium_polylepis.1